MEFEISTNKPKLNIEFIWNYLSNESYWAEGRSLAIVKKSIENSLCFGVYLSDGRQVGFARVVTDYSVFAWVLDLFVDAEFVGKGIGQKLMSTIVSHPDLQNLKRWGLCTLDAHGLYEKFDFHKLMNPDIHMERVLNV